MLIAAIFLLCSTAWLVCATRGSERVAQVAVAPLAMAFVLIYVFVGTLVAQDREQYYLWYTQAQAILSSGGGPDPLFTLLLATLPERLDRPVFGILFSSLLFAALAAFAYRANPRCSPNAAAGLIMLVAISDRLFLDLCTNTSRSALAGLLLLSALVVHDRRLAVLIIVVAAALHIKFTVLAVILGTLAYAMRNRPSWQSLLLVIGLVFLGLRAASGRTFFDDLAIIELILQSEREDFRRGVSITSGVTGSRVVQITLAVLLPLFLAHGARTRHFLLPTAEAQRMNLIRSVAITFSAAGLILYPEFQLAERLFLVPMLLLPTLMPLDRLKALAALKIQIICVVLLTQFDRLY